MLDSCLLLAEGHLYARGNSERVIAQYHQSETLDHHGFRSLMPDGASEPQPGGTHGIGRASCDETGVAGSIRMGSTVSLRVKFEAPWPIRPCLGLTIKTERGFRVFHVSDRFANQLANRLMVTSGVDHL